MRNFFLNLLLFLALAGYSQHDEKQKLFEIYGHVMMDMGYNFNQIHPDYFDVVRPSQLPSFENEYGTDGNLWFSVRQSLFGVKRYFPTPADELRTIFEFDLFGLGANAGETTFHLTNAYAELGHFGFGRFWSVFVDYDAFPNSIEAWYRIAPGYPVE